MENLFLQVTEKYKEWFRYRESTLSEEEEEGKTKKDLQENLDR